MSKEDIKEKFKAVCKLKGIRDYKALAKIMGLSEGYAKQLWYRKTHCPAYMKLVVHLFEKSLDN